MSAERKVVLTLPNGLIDWSAFDPLHTDENPLFGASTPLGNGTHLVVYYGVRDDLVDFVQPEVVVTGCAPVTPGDPCYHDPDYLVNDPDLSLFGKTCDFIGATVGVPITITCSYNGPDASWNTPVNHPRGGKAYFYTTAVAGVMTINVTVDAAGAWEITQEMLNIGVPAYARIKFRGLLIKASMPTS